jgi:hypothetical protein
VCREKFWLLYQPTVTVGGKDGIGLKVLKNSEKQKKPLENSGKSEGV